jgi:hypothetical protein
LPLILGAVRAPAPLQAAADPSYCPDGDEKPASTNPVIAQNKKAAFNYFFEERFEAGMVLEGWEVKALRAARRS